MSHEALPGLEPLSTTTPFGICERIVGVPIPSITHESSLSIASLKSLTTNYVTTYTAFTTGIEQGKMGVMAMRREVEGDSDA